MIPFSVVTIVNCYHCMKELSKPFKTIPGSRFPQSTEQWHHYCKACWVKLNGPRANCYPCVRKKIRCPYHDYANDTEEGPYKRRIRHDNSDD